MTSTSGLQGSVFRRIKKRGIAVNFLCLTSTQIGWHLQRRPVPFFKLKDPIHAVL